MQLKTSHMSAGPPHHQNVLQLRIEEFPPFVFMSDIKYTFDELMRRNFLECQSGTVIKSGQPLLF